MSAAGRIVRFVPQRGYGFVGLLNAPDVFFHVGCFQRLVPGGPGPVLGEDVLVGDILPSDRGRERASWVKRTAEPPLVRGRVLSFHKSYGFVEDEFGERLFLHLSELTPGWFPSPGLQVSFHRGYTEGDESKPRACWVRPKRESVHGQ